MSLLILLLLFWKPAYHLSRYFMYKEDEQFGLFKNWWLGLWDLVKPPFM